MNEDPMERRDVRTKGGQRAIFKELKGHLKAWDAQAQVSNAQYEGSHEGTQMLEALGYMEGEDDAAVDDAEAQGLSGPTFPEDAP